MKRTVEQFYTSIDAWREVDLHDKEGNIWHISGIKTGDSVYVNDIYVKKKGCADCVEEFDWQSLEFLNYTPEEYKKKKRKYNFVNPFLCYNPLYGPDDKDLFMYPYVKVPRMIDISKFKKK